MKASEAFLLHGEMVSTGLRQEGNYRETYVGVLKSVETGEKEFLVVQDPKVDIYIVRPQFRTNTNSVHYLQSYQWKELLWLPSREEDVV